MLTFLFILLAINWTTTLVCSVLIGWLIYVSYNTFGTWEGTNLLMESKVIKRLCIGIYITTISGLVLVMTSYIVLQNS